MGKGEEQLLEAVKAQDIPQLQKLIHKGKGKLLGSSRKVNLNYQDPEGFTALHQAAVSGSVDIVYLLIDGNANVDMRDKKGLRPLHYCAWKGKVELVAAFLSSGASCNSPASNGCTPLHLAAQYGHYDACKILLQYGADVSARQTDGSTALDLASEFGRTEVVDLLLNSRDAAGLVGHFHNQVPDTDPSSTSSPLHLASRNGHTEIVRSLLQAGLDINWRSSAGTCLHEAVANDKAEIVQLLIDCGIDVNKRSGLGQTALELARKVGKSPANMDIVRKLTEAQPKLMQVMAMNDFQNILDKASLAFTKGTLITVLEQNQNGNWKGKIEGVNGLPARIGYFPASYVQLYQQSSLNTSIAGSDDSGIHPHDEDTHWTPSQWPRHVTPTKSLPHKYVNMDPRNIATHQHVSKVMLVSPNVNNPSYDDVICSQQSNSSTRERPVTLPHVGASQPITVSRSLQGGVVVRPHITNPGYEDVLMDNSSASSPTNTYTPAASGRSSVSDSNQAKSEGSNSAMEASYVKQFVRSRSDEQVYRWLTSLGMAEYTKNFLEEGYDLPTIARINPADLAAIRISKPPHRKKLATHASLLRKDTPPSPQIKQIPNSVGDFLDNLGLQEYAGLFASGGVGSLEKLIQTTWEDLQELHVDKLGHQKKLMIAIEKLGQAYRHSQDMRTKPPQKNSHHVPLNPHHGPLNPHHGPLNPHHGPLNPHHGPLNPSRKLPVQEKPSKQLSSFKENPALSVELQKALMKRQKVINDADAIKREERNAPTAPQPAPYERPLVAAQRNEEKSDHSSRVPTNHVARGAGEQHFRRANSCRGPPPHPPKRTSSICVDDLSPVDDTRSIAAMMGGQYNDRSKQPPKSPQSSHLPFNHVFPYPTPTTKPNPQTHSPIPQNELVQSSVPQSYPFVTLPPNQSNHPHKKIMQTSNSIHNKHQSDQHSTASLQPIPVTANPLEKIIPKPMEKLPPKPLDKLPQKPAISAKPKPSLVPKPATKPVVAKKVEKVTTNQPPQGNQASYSLEHDPQSPTSVVKKTFDSEIGKRFDLSVLDQIDQQNQATKPTFLKPSNNPTPAPTNPNPRPSNTPTPITKVTSSVHSLVETQSLPSMKRVDSIDDFEWPAPPPSMSGPPENNAPSQYPALPPVTPPSPVEVRTCFEEDEDTGTVKRRPSSVSNREDVVLNPPITPRGWPMHSLPTGVSSKFNGQTPSRVNKKKPPPPHRPKPTQPITSPPRVPSSKPSLPGKPVSPSGKVVIPLDVPPPIPRKMNQQSPQESPMQSDTGSKQVTNQEQATSQQMLDDIGSMFDDLVQEFDHILS